MLSSRPSRNSIGGENLEEDFKIADQRVDFLYFKRSNYNKYKSGRNWQKTPIEYSQALLDGFQEEE